MQSSKVQNSINIPYSGEFHGPIPISPHVNVPNTHTFSHMAPPVPPRRKDRNKDYVLSAQVKQAPDAPTLPPRDKSPPPVPPRFNNQICANSNLTHGLRIHNLKEETVEIKEHYLMQPHTSTIMMRRNSALEKNSKPIKSLDIISSVPSASVSNYSLTEQNLIQLSPDSNVVSCFQLR